MAQYSILLADRNRGNEILLRTLFKEIAPPHEFHWVQQQEEALDYLFQRGGQQEARRPSLIILGLSDPAAILRILKQDEERRAIPVVVMTPGFSKAEVQEFYRLGASAYVKMPTSYDGVADLVAAMCRLWLNFATA